MSFSSCLPIFVSSFELTLLFFLQELVTWTQVECCSALSERLCCQAGVGTERYDHVESKEETFVSSPVTFAGGNDAYEGERRCRT